MSQYSSYIARKEARGIIAKLDAATHSLHDSLDGNSQHMFSEKMTLQDYRKLLERFYGFYLPFEQRYDAIEQMPSWQEVGLDLAQRKRLPLLEEDLRALGATEEEISHLAQFEGSKELFSSLPQIIGSLYAIEGSTQGELMMAPMLGQVLHIDVEHGVTYFNGYGPTQTGVMWNEFQDKINAFAERHPEYEEEILATARAHFAATETWLLG
ncbi:biliverdin-producing heme oxygenase [Ktedonosporobacter rubrisoli]|nr:biliverdin-producing heme oxygenase [Ktedonosporobacter rubrisoli]